MNAASFDQRGRSWSATWRQTWRALASSACRKARRSAAATTLRRPLGTCAKAERIQCTRQRCQVAPSTRRIAPSRALVGVRDDQLHALEATLDQAPQERGPEGLGLARA